MLEERPEFRPFSASCSPRYIDELLEYTGVSLANPEFHDTRDLLEDSLGMLRLRPMSVERAPVSEEAAEPGAEGAGDEAEGAVAADTDGEDDADDDDDDDDMCDDAAWDVLERCLGFRHTFDPNDCPWLLYNVLTPVLLTRGVGVRCDDAGVFDGSGVFDGESDDLPIFMDSKLDFKGSIHSRFSDESDSSDSDEEFRDAVSEEQEKPAMVPNATATRLKPFLTELARGAVVNFRHASLGTEESLWPFISAAGGIWLGDADFVPLERCVWEPGCGEIWQQLLRIGCKAGRIVAIKPALHDLLLEPLPEHLDAADEAIAKEAIANMVGSLGTRAVQGRRKQSGGSGGRAVTAAARLPHPTDFEMMLGSVLPWLLERDGVCGRATEGPGDVTAEEAEHHRWSDETMACYAAVLAALESDGGGFPPGRWAVPVPTATLGLSCVVLDRKLNRLRGQEAGQLVVLPDASTWPVSTALVLQHFGGHCLNPALAQLFSQIAGRQSVGLETPCRKVQRTLKRCLRIAAAGPGQSELWSLIGEVCERPLDSLSQSAPTASPAAGNGASTIDTQL